MDVITGTAPLRRIVVALIDGSVHELDASEVTDQRGKLECYSGRVHDEQPEVVASFRSSLVAWWRAA